MDMKGLIEDGELLSDSQNIKEKFFKVMRLNGFDFSDIDETTKLPKFLIPVIDNVTEDFNKFNILLAKLHKNKEVNILEALSILVEDYLEPTLALKCLDELNYVALTTELKEKFKIKSAEKQDLSILDFLN
jgi:hypothetical protein